MSFDDVDKEALHDYFADPPDDDRPTAAELAWEEEQARQAQAQHERELVRDRQRYEMEFDLRLGIVRVIDTHDADRPVMFTGLWEDALEWVEHPESRDTGKPDDYPF